MTEISNLSSELIELILSFLPIPNLIQASTVCKLWNSIISSPSFSDRHINRPWFIFHGVNEISSHNNQTFAFDPTSNSWFVLPTTTTPHHHRSKTTFFGTNGFLFITYPEFLYTSIFHPFWQATPPLHSLRYNPLVGVLNDGSVGLRPKFIVVGVPKYLHFLVDLNDPVPKHPMDFDVEIYDPVMESWDVGPPLPEKIRSVDLCHSSSAALFKGKFYVLHHMYNGFVSSFDLHQRVWRKFRTIGPPGVMKSFLIAGREQLILAGHCVWTHGSFIKLWKVDEKTMEFTEISVMPHDLLCSLFDGGDEVSKISSFKCVGMGDLVYVFNESKFQMHHPACVCEVSSESGNCVWRRVPQLPSPMNSFCEILTFCSAVSLQSILGRV